ncbi:MAG: L-fucose:H+ symporter permease [Janthinobacterium lividum]
MNLGHSSQASTPVDGTGAAPVRLFPAEGRLPFALITILFFLWGMSNNLTDILVQQFRKSFELSPLEAQLVQTAVFFGYFCMAIPAALVTRRHGYKTGILTGLCFFGVGLLMFWPAAIVGRYWFMLAALFVVGCGSAALETTANPYIAQAGPAASSERRLNFSQAFNPPGTITGVLVGTYFIFSGIELAPERIGSMKVQGIYGAYLHSELMRVVPTYVTLGCIVLAFAAVMGFVRFPALQNLDEIEDVTPLLPELWKLLQSPRLLAAMFAQFCYCGAQVSTWSAFIPYVKQYAATSERAAGLFLTGNLIAFAAGRLLSTAMMRWFRPARMMSAYALMNIVLLAIGVLRPGRVGASAILATSFFMSVMYPTIFALGIKGYGAQTKLASSLLVMSVIGAGVVPPLLGLVAKHAGSYALGYIIVIVCYLVVLAYGLHDQSPENTAATPRLL